MTYGFIFRLHSRKHGTEDIEYDTLQGAIEAAVRQAVDAAALHDGITRTATILQKTVNIFGRGKSHPVVLYSQKTRSV